MKKAARDNRKKNAEEHTKLVCIKDQRTTALFKGSVNVYIAISIFSGI